MNAEFSRVRDLAKEVEMTDEQTNPETVESQDEVARRLQRSCSTALHHHLVWSIEMQVGECPHCKGNTVLGICNRWAEIDEEQAVEAVGQSTYDHEFAEGVSLAEEMTVHYCPSCERITAFSLNACP